MDWFRHDDDKSRKNLSQVIQDYRLNRERLLHIQTKTKDGFAQITHILKPTTAALLECINTENLNSLAFELGACDNKPPLQKENSFTEQVFTVFDMLIDSARLEIGNPAIAIIGQVKAGKSTFVNNLLRKNVVCQSFETCTARLTRLTYSKTNFVEIIDVDGKVLEKKKLRNCTIPENYLQLKENDRNDPLETGKQILAGIASDFLKLGIDIIDSPGLSENAILNNLSKNMIRSILPVMIYVIDGRTSVKQTDISELLELKNSFPNLQIIYFITKLDTEDLSESGNTDPIKLADMKMEIAFTKLQYNNFIPTSFNHWSECTYFHGASLYAYMDYIRKKRTPETLYHYKLFSKFEADLHSFLLLNFENKIHEASNTIINFLMDVMTKIISRAKVLSDFSKDNFDQITMIKKIEEELFRKVKEVITNSRNDLMNRLVRRLKDETDAIVHPIGSMEYPNSLRIPSNGILTDKKLIKQCQNHIMYAICQGLENIIKQFVEEELFQKYQNAIEDQITTPMKDKIKSQNSKVVEKTLYSLCLEKIIVQNYKFHSYSGLTNSEGYTAKMKMMNDILTSIRHFLTKLFKSHSNKKGIDVKSSNWKMEQAKECLNHCQHRLLVEEVCRNLIDDFEKKHNSFLLALEYEHKFIHQKIKISEEIRMQVAEKAPDFAGLLMLTLDVKSRYMLHGIEQKEKIGQGAQGEVYRCICNGKELAKKTTRVRVEELNEIAEEIFYSYSFEHPRLLPMIAISILDTDDPGFKSISVYSPLKKIDVLKYIKQNRTTLISRLQIGLQVAEALQYLHKQQIMHRDLKLANILLDENNDVFLADYGFCKSIALTEFSYVGTPVHIAPEILRNGIYDHKIDIYSFGILLWYLSQGTGQHPKYAKSKDKLMSADMRPERIPNIPNELWNLMEACWQNDPSHRPEVGVIISNIMEIISKC